MPFEGESKHGWYTFARKLHINVCKMSRSVMKAHMPVDTTALTERRELRCVCARMWAQSNFMERCSQSEQESAQVQTSVAKNRHTRSSLRRGHIPALRLISSVRPPLSNNTRQHMAQRVVRRTSQSFKPGIARNWLRRASMLQQSAEDTTQQYIRSSDTVT